MIITTNNVARELITFFDLPDNLKGEFDYLDEIGKSEYRFFLYKGRAYDTGDMMRVIPHTLPAGSIILGWDGYVSETYFSGIVVRFTDDYSRVIVGSYTS